jgi:hypothetical protein
LIATTVEPRACFSPNCSFLWPSRDFQGRPAGLYLKPMLDVLNKCVHRWWGHHSTNFSQIWISLPIPTRPFPICVDFRLISGKFLFFLFPRVFFLLKSHVFSAKHRIALCASVLIEVSPCNASCGVRSGVQNIQPYSPSIQQCRAQHSNMATLKNRLKMRIPNPVPCL